MNMGLPMLTRNCLDIMLAIGIGQKPFHYMRDIANGWTMERNFGFEVGSYEKNCSCHIITHTGALYVNPSHRYRASNMVQI